MQRQFVEIEDAKPGETVSIMSFNVLAVDFASPEEYNWCRQADLSWHKRFPHIIDEITQVNPDILCLQEVQPDTSDQFARALPDYEVLSGFIPRSPDEQYAAARCGNLLLFRRERFSCRSMSLMPLIARQRLSIEQRACYEEDPTTGWGWLDWGVTAALEHSSGMIVHVGCVHLKWSRFQRLERQCVQLALTIHELQRQQAVYGGGAVVIAGDFNSEPSVRGLPTREGWTSEAACEHPLSPVYEMACCGCVEMSKHVFAASADSALIPMELMTQTEPPWQATSAYKAVLGQELRCTNHDSDGPCSLDFIFVGDDDRVQVKGCHSIMDFDENTPLPTHDSPSDHLWVAAEIVLLDPS